MAVDTTPMKEEMAAGTVRLYHHVTCKQMKGLKITLTDQGKLDKKAFSIMGVSSKETIRAGLKAVDASPFKTVFVVHEQTGQVLFALSQNADYVKSNRKKDPPPPPPPNTDSLCCQNCFRMGGYKCDTFEDGSCICYGATQGGPSHLDDELGTMPH